jgi:hypothetical protein
VVGRRYFFGPLLLCFWHLFGDLDENYVQLAKPAAAFKATVTIIVKIMNNNHYFEISLTRNSNGHLSTIATEKSNTLFAEYYILA